MAFTLGSLAKALLDRRGEILVLQADRAPAVRMGSVLAPAAGLPVISAQELETLIATFVDARRLDLGFRLGPPGDFRVSLAIAGGRRSMALSRMGGAPIAAGPPPPAFGRAASGTGEPCPGTPPAPILSRPRTAGG